MAGGGGGQASPGDDSAFNVIWAIIAIFAIGILIWITFSEQLKYCFIQIRKYELLLINSVIKILPLELLNFGSVKQELTQLLLAVEDMKPDDLTLDIASTLSLVVGNYLCYPVSVCLIYFSYYGFFKNVSSKYTKAHDMFSLAKQEKIEWPQINPVIGLDLVKAPLNTGPWAMGKSPVDFCKEHELIKISIEDVKEFRPGDNSVKYRMVLDQVKAAAVFSSQLGELWQSPEKLPIHRRALFSVFLARGCREPKVAQHLLEQINRSCNSKKPYDLNFDKVDSIWPKFYNKRPVQELVQSHAYGFTLFIDLLLLARQDGVLANSDFLWLKPIDRLFWYILCSTGRKTYFVEAAGVHAHFLVEKALGKPLSIPYIAEAVKALNAALEEIIYIPTEEEQEKLLKQV